MVDALREAHRVLMPTGILIDIRPVTRPIVIEVLIDSHGVWAKTVDAYSAPDDVGAAERPAFRSTSTSIAIVPQSCRFTQKPENCAGKRSLMKNWNSGAGSWAR